MRKAKILYKNEYAGNLIQHNDGSFSFVYAENWLSDTNKPSISLSLPKRKKEFHSKYLFPFFYNMLPEGSNREVVCKLNRIDLQDYFGILLHIAKQDNIGAIRVLKIDD